MADSPFHLSDAERYGFDLQGYVVVPGALRAAVADACNRAIDAVGGTRSAGAGMLGWPAPHREPFRRLLVHPAVVARLNELCGERFRLDHGPRLITGDTPAEELQGGGEPFSPAEWYHQQNGRIFASAVTAAWQLAGEGGVCVVPGSHKSAEPTPAGVRAGGDRGAAMDVVRELPTRAGDLVLFAETVMHGTRRGNGAGDRRVVLYSYAARATVAHAGRAFLPEEVWGDWTRELTPEQRAVLYGPGVDAARRRPVLESDGAMARVREADRVLAGGPT